MARIPKSRLSLLVAAPGDADHAMRPLSRTISLLQRGIPSQLENLRSVLAPVMPEFEPLLGRYENSVSRLRELLEQNFSTIDRIAVINRIARNEVDEILSVQHDGLEALVGRTLRHVAGQVAKQGYNIFALKPRKTKMKKASAGGGGYDDGEGSIEFLKAPKVKRSKAETWNIESIIDVLDQIISRSPGQYYAAWSSLQAMISKWWIKLLRVYTAHIEGVRLILSATPIRTASMLDEPDLDTFTKVVTRVQSDKLVRSAGSITVPGKFCHQINTQAAVAVLLEEMDEQFVPDPRTIKREVRDLHKASATRVNYTSLLDAMLEAAGRWHTDLQTGVFRPHLSAEFILADRAQGDLPALESVGQRINGSFIAKFKFASTPVTEKSSRTTLKVEFVLSKRLTSRVLRAYLRDVDLDETEPSFDVALTALISRISGEVKAATKHDITLTSKVESDEALVFMRLSAEIPVKRIPGSRPSLIVKTRASLTSVLGSAETVFAHAISANNESITIDDSYCEFVDTRSGVLYSINATFRIQAEDLSRRASDDIRRALVFVAQMSNEEALHAEAIPSRTTMIGEFVELHGAAKVRVAGGRALNRRIVIQHDSTPSRTFEVVRARTYGDKRKFTICVNGEKQIVSSEDGWRELG